jgi:hypothetical protein
MSMLYVLYFCWFFGAFVAFPAWKTKAQWWSTRHEGFLIGVLLSMVFIFIGNIGAGFSTFANRLSYSLGLAMTLLSFLYTLIVDTRRTVRRLPVIERDGAYVATMAYYGGTLVVGSSLFLTIVFSQASLFKLVGLILVDLIFMFVSKLAIISCSFPQRPMVLKFGR